jgi:hypothetical protein
MLPYQRYRALISIETGDIIFGSLPPGTYRVVREWARRHEAELMENWNRARARLPLERIPGADVE